MTNNNIYPTSEQNYGKKDLIHTQIIVQQPEQLFRNAFGQLKANVIDPVMDGFRHTKLTLLRITMVT